MTEHEAATTPGSATAALSVRDLSKSFAGNPALSHLNLTIEPGEIHALVGQNGSGKSTFIKVLSGYHLPDPGGSVSSKGEMLHFGSAESSHRLGLRFVHQDLGLVATATIIDNFFFGVGYPTRFGTIRAKRAITQAQTALEHVGLHVNPREKVATLGAAQRTQLAVARALFHWVEAPPNLLVLDEPTATLPIDEVDHLLETVRAVAKRGVTVLYVSHHLDEVFRIANRVTALRDGELVATSDVGDIDRLALISQIVGSAVDEVTREQLPQVEAQAKYVLEVRDLTAGPLRSVSFAVRPGEVVGLAGITGSGRETVLSSIFGAVPRDSGQVLVAGKVLGEGMPGAAIDAGMAYLPSDRKAQGGIMPLSARENLTISNLWPFWSRLRLHRKKELAETRQWFTRLAIRPDQAFEMPLATFSGGNQQKILFAKWLRRGLPVLLLDDPTQGVDVGAKAELHRHLLEVAQQGTAVLVSSTDSNELNVLCDRVLVIRGGTISDEIDRARLSQSEIDKSILADAGSNKGELQ